MHPLDNARNLFHEGRFRDALAELGNSTDSASGHTAQMLRAELLERLGKHSQSEALLQKLVKAKSLTPQDKSAAEHIFGRIAIENRRIDTAITHFQRAVAIARKADDLVRACWSGLFLTLLVAERIGPDAAAPLLAQVRVDVIKLGDPVVSAGLHVYVGEMEAKRGLLQSAERHIRLAQAILSGSSNIWLESAAENTSLAIAVLRSDLDGALVHARQGLELAEASGAVSSLRASLGNLGNLFTVRGDFERAVEYFQRSLAVLPSRSENNNASLDSLARIRLSQDRLDDCAAFLDEIEGTIHEEADRVLYAHRYAELTRTLLIARYGRVHEALAHSDVVQTLAKRAHDKLLSRMALLVKSELLLRVRRSEESLASLREVVLDLETGPPDLYAQCEGIMACGLAAAGKFAEAEKHFARAERIYNELQSVQGPIELRRSWTILGPNNEPRSSPDRNTRPVDGSVLHSISTMLLYVNRPEIVSAELMEVLRNTGCIEAGTAISRGPDGSERIVSRFGDGEATSSSLLERKFSFGGSERPTIDFVFHVKNEIEALATMGAVECLIKSVQELNQARTERDERMTLWPVDELPIDGDGERSVISGHMRDLMNFARRVAKTNVNVLITGESGTGKEILARAVHNFSDRAEKPFVPFNCTAIPRDLLESQLFGHRRGAFTGADRDHPGLIRSAREGTLFLDEVGELGLDLQPKLLRFLESGEISPLGEQGPLTVNVRIIAATNANLEDAVRDGRFREDLYYRLNVVRLSIRPLRERRDEIPGFVNHFVARAAEEFKKGRLNVAEETMERLLLYRWPGNVRQLQNELRRMVALAEPDSTLSPDAISEAIMGAMPIFRHAPPNGKEIAVPLHDKLVPTLARIECEMIKAAFREHHGKVDAVAKALGISRKGLYLKRQRLGL